MKKVIFIILLIFSLLYSQESWTKTYKIPNWDRLFKACEADFGYMLVGKSGSDMMMLKLDENADIIWNKRIIEAHPNCIIQSKDGNFLIAAQTNIWGNFNTLLIKVDPDGEILWTKEYGHETSEKAVAIVETQDNGFLLGGSSRFFSGDMYEQFWIVKTDSLGNFDWEKTYNHRGTEITSLFQLNDGSYIGSGLYDVYDEDENWWITGSAIFKLNSAGDENWLKTYYKSYQPTTLVKPCHSDRYMMGINRSGNDNYRFWLIITDTLGDSIWSRIYDRKQIYESNDNFVDLIQTKDNGYALVGNSITWVSNGNGYIGYDDVWLVRTNETGDTLWTNNYGGEYHEYPVSISQTTDDGFLIFSNTGKSYSSDLYIIKTDATGNTKNYVHLLSPFSLMEPSDDSIINSTSVVFRWQQAEQKKFVATGLKYQLFLDTHPTFSDPKIITVETDSTLIISSLIPGTTYFWKVLAKNIAGDSLWSSETNAFFVSHDATSIQYLVSKNPKAFKLYANYPNPFNPKTTIKYYLPSYQSVFPVKIKIYDALGRLITTLKDEPQNPGMHSVKWNVKNTAGQNMSSGIYFCVVEAGQFKATQKILLVR